ERPRRGRVRDRGRPVRPPPAPRRARAPRRRPDVGRPRLRGGPLPRRRARRGARRHRRGGAPPHLAGPAHAPAARVRGPGDPGASPAAPTRTPGGLMPDVTAPLVDFATSQIGSYGALAVLLLMVLESACIPVPSEAIMLYGGFLVARGQASLIAIVAAGVA